MKPLFIAAVLVALSALTACTVGPDYRPVSPAVPASWPEQDHRGTVAGTSPVVEEWWTTFHDPELDSLIRRAVAGNYDLKVAAARVEEARAGVGIARSEAFPQVSVSATAQRTRQTAIGVLPPPPGSTGVSIRRVPFETNIFQGLADMSWEIDLFGRIRRGIEAARADFAAQQQDRRDVLITVLGDVAVNYAEVRGFQLRLILARKNIALQEDTLDLTRALARAGQVTERDVSQAESLLESTKSTVPTLESGLATSVHRLSVLVGAEPEALRSELAGLAPVPPVPPDVPTGLPSDLLKRRPDIRRAERELAAATARVGQAKAEYFPRLSLTGSAGREAPELHELTLGFNNIFVAGPSITLPLFTGGRLRANVAAQEARVKESFNAYQATVLRALEETDNALVAYSNDQDRRDQLQRAVAADQDALHLAQTQYQAGLADFLTVLDAERTLLNSQDQLAQTQTAVTTDLVMLYKALGGGWSVLPNGSSDPGD